MKKLLSILSLLLILTTVLTGCRFEIFPTQGPDVPYSPDEPYVDYGYAPAMWRVTDDEGHELYLFGTIHCGDERNETVLKKITPTLRECDALAVEFDLVAFENDLQAQIECLTPLLLTDGRTINDLMPADLYDDACDLLKEAGLYDAEYKYYDLSIWSDLVENALVELSGLDYDYGMDDLLTRRAYDLGIEVREVESAKEQYELSAEFDDELYLLLIEDNLTYRDDYVESLKETYEYWLAGLDEEFADDGEYDEDEYTERELELIEDYNKKLLDDRNVKMADKAQAYLAEGKTVFFAVGAAHMENEAGLVSLLTERGYNVERVDYDGAGGEYTPDVDDYIPYVTGDPDDLL